ncbi:lipocalin-like domain-containing protein [Belnapia rosea]|uniref:Lipocalin-like domain-containing protein n=1 Tax=Belnapia rosea TaxID=938405 RepID=A0A1G6NNT3_9PROT|nr:lipocalin-like domain-containing protein [Belnapia rosea]SDC68947.1 Lipocalin-like domain-containing protein [Belnapia rosea]
MFRRTGLALPGAMMLALSCLPGRRAAAQAATLGDGILGTWTLVSATSQREDGTRGEPFGPNPKGVMMFARDGHFSLFQSRAELPRLAANDRARATPEEAMAVVRDSIAYYGTYTVDEAGRSLWLRLEGSTYANLLGDAPQRRIINRLTATELAFSNPRTPNGLTLHAAWRRAPPP